MFTTASSTTASSRHEMLDWGPARRDPEHPLHALNAGSFDPFDLRDASGERPDDN
ncbi:MAG: hypothetical protein FWE71_04160 [Nocardioidaceae bacterium]|nr:hypothetical protein [Nocardioidaceae bacterium]MCL2612629.1 hypothetical protein [Nocardioidaceae bacterium]